MILIIIACIIVGWIISRPIIRALDLKAARCTFCLWESLQARILSDERLPACGVATGENRQLQRGHPNPARSRS